LNNTAASIRIAPSLDSFLDAAILTLNSNFAGVEAQVDILAQDIQPRGLLVDLVKQRLCEIKNFTDFVISQIRSEKKTVINNHDHDHNVAEEDGKNDIEMLAVTGV
jgi:hypothetical protein